MIISGHNHGGMFPNWMKPFLKMARINTDLVYPTYTKGMFDINCGQSKIVISERITKFHPGFGRLEFLEKFHEGTVENIKIKKL